jgi:hypothetical protein
VKALDPDDPTFVSPKRPTTPPTTTPPEAVSYVIVKLYGNTLESAQQVAHEIAYSVDDVEDATPAYHVGGSKFIAIGDTEAMVQF